MDGDIFNERIAELLRVIQYAKVIKEDNVPCKIDEGLYLGSLGAANNRSALKSLNVTHILTVANSLNPAHPNDFTYKRIQVFDREDVNISQFFEECFAFIDEARTTGGGVLVHCFAGKSRSVTIVVAYLMYKNGMSFSEALEHVKTKRPVAFPNFGFISQLREYEKTLQDNGTGRAQEVGSSSSSL
ncbi:dual specificity protein phosphatase 1 [Andrographis paniculata]|uniref:dual specificity protein phosphatase 1 n=1 Tax=Andrographis paniculata TaxID=175694 RepID=UPI0021E8F124|nr:dual specificity protein phosphatase 1 [Andrographis paniculata]XP_051125453.1 dual specificity protein phosphatase 1 [Andrographis paniculata]XP_051125463.1 dual specificity protein phosphatase 1 [Andrographis paniculata]